MAFPGLHILESAHWVSHWPYGGCVSEQLSFCVYLPTHMRGVTIVNSPYVVWTPYIYLPCLHDSEHWSLCVAPYAPSWGSMLVKFPTPTDTQRVARNLISANAYPLKLTENIQSKLQHQNINPKNSKPKISNAYNMKRPM